MPYCCKCGTQVGDKDVFCGKCGTRQSAQPNPSADFLANIPPRVASMLCYIPVVGWIPCVVVLASERYRHDRLARFHAFQGLYLFVAWLIVDMVLSPMFGHLPIPIFFFHTGSVNIFKLAVFAVWIFMIVKTSQDQVYKLPVLGELAERSVAEQR
jgi:uncharacterized membrane protein